MIYREFILKNRNFYDDLSWIKIYFRDRFFFAFKKKNETCACSLVLDKNVCYSNSRYI